MQYAVNENRDQKLDSYKQGWSSSGVTADAIAQIHCYCAVSIRFSEVGEDKTQCAEGPVLCDYEDDRIH